MTSYNIITDAETDPSAPLTAELAKKWRDNPIAIAEGSTSAPFVRQGWHPYNGTVVGGANTGRIYNFATDGSITSIETPNFEDGYEYKIVFSQIDGGSTGSNSDNDINISLYFETSAVYRSLSWVINRVNVGGYLRIRDFNGTFEINRPRFTSNVFLTQQQGYAGALATATTTSNSIGTAFTHSTAQKILKAKIEMLTYGFGAGEIFLFRRSVY